MNPVVVTLASLLILVTLYSVVQTWMIVRLNGQLDARAESYLLANRTAFDLRLAAISDQQTIADQQQVIDHWKERQAATQRALIRQVERASKLDTRHTVD